MDQLIPQNVTPCFSLNGSQVEILVDPSSFYERLLELSATSKERIVVASLYLGCGEKEKRLRDEWYNALTNNSNNPNFRMKFLFEFSRGSRHVKGGEGNITKQTATPIEEKPMESSRTMLLPLLHFRDNHSSKSIMEVAFFCSPSLRGFLSKVLTQPYNEILNIQHMKILVFDNTVVLTGANLSNDYFTERQDRYIVLSDCKHLADFLEHLMDATMSLSYRLLSDNTLESNSSVDPCQGSKADYLSHAKAVMQSFVQQTLLIPESSLSRNNAQDTLVYPSVQMKLFDVENDERMMHGLLNAVQQGDTLEMHLASGYFNLTEDYQALLLSWMSRELGLKVLCASLEANGFLVAPGVIGYIPYIYQDCANRFHNRVKSSPQSHRCSILEYYRDKWTFHAKGLWLSRKPDSVFLTAVGSSNFGYRSTYSDLECQYYIQTANVDLQRRLCAEREYIYQYSRPMRTDVSPTTTGLRNAPKWLHYLVPLVKRFF